MERKMEALYADCCQKIADKCKELNHKDGYRFLLCPKKMFSKETKILFLDLCPSLDTKEPHKVYSDNSCEHGCAYFSERWYGYLEGQAPLQIQVNQMLALLKDSFGIYKKTSVFADEEVLSAYFIPFKFKSFSELDRSRQEYFRSYSRDLWRTILRELNPQIIISMGSVVQEDVKKIFVGEGFIEGRKESIVSGWDKKNLIITRYIGKNTEIKWGHLPHLSRFKLFSRDECREPLKIFMNKLCEID